MSDSSPLAQCMKIGGHCYPSISWEQATIYTYMKIYKAHIMCQSQMGLPTWNHAKAYMAHLGIRGPGLRPFAFYLKSLVPATGLVDTLSHIVIRSAMQLPFELASPKPLDTRIGCS